LEYKAQQLKFPTARILVFAKAPVEYQVKTRLIPDIGEKRSTALYQLMLEQTIATVTNGQFCNVELCCTPNTSHSFFINLAEKYPVTLTNQLGSDLGQRMLNAATHSLKTSNSVVIVGTDCLQITEALLGQVLAGLTNKTSDALITPARDGGYVLLGLSKLHPDLFTGIDWGTDKVMAQTRNALTKLGWKWQETPVLRDLDTFADLEHIYQNEHQYQMSTGVRDLIKSIFN
jgi:rSAM/selenodomain-associated transferase 1